MLEHSSSHFKPINGLNMECRIQADRFYNAYLLLQRNNDYFMEQMTTVPKRDKGLPPDVLETISVDIVCLAFSLELYFKDLHFVLKGEYPRGHDTLELFETLPEKIQQDIFSYHATKRCMRNLLVLKSEIEKISDGFKKWRYSYEFRTLRYETGFVLDLINSVRIAADRIRTQNSYTFSS